jgi:hypothetical protein
MKAISNTLILLVAACGLAFAEEKSGSGFLRIINAVAQGSGKVAFAINGRDVYVDGYTLGQTTGEYGVKTGEHVITVRKTGVETGRTNIQLKDGETVTLIAFAERMPQKELSDPPKWAVRLLRMKQQDEAKGFALTLVSVCKADETAVDLLSSESGAVEKAFVKRLSIIKRDLDRKRGEVFIRMGDRVLTSVLPESPGNNVVIFYEDREGRIEALSYYDPKLLAEG